MTSSSNTIYDLYNKVDSQESFSDFLEQLSDDFKTDMGNWESIKVDALLLTIAAFARDYSAKNPQAFANFPWKEVALLFLAGKSYE